MPPEETISVPAEERPNTVLSALFGEGAPPVDTPKEESKAEPAKAPAKKQAKTAPVADVGDDGEEQEAPEDETEEEEDYEAPLPAKEEAKPEPEKDDERETIARKQAKENGRKAKELETQLTAEKLEKETIADKLAKAEQKIAEYESVNLRPQDHPEFVSLQDSILARRDNAIEDLILEEVIPMAAGDAFRGSFPARVGECERAMALPVEDRTEAFKTIKSRIAQTIFGKEYEELFDEEKKEADKTVNSLFKTVKDNVPEVKKLRELASSLEEKAKNGHLEMGVKEYSAVTAEFKPILDKIGDLPEEAIEASPYALESLVAKMAKGTPEEQKRLKSAKRDAEELLIGPAPLTQTDLDRLKANGIEPKEYLKQRDKAFKAKRLKLIPLIVQALATRSTVQALLAKGGQVVETESQIEEEEDVLLAAKKRGPGRPKKEAPKGPAAERRNSVLAGIFGDDD